MERNENKFLAKYGNVHIMVSRDILNTFLQHQCLHLELGKNGKVVFHNKFTCEKKNSHLWAQFN